MFKVKLSNVDDGRNVQYMTCIAQLCKAAVNRLVWMGYSVYVVCYVIYVNHIRFGLECGEGVNVDWINDKL